MELWKQTEGEGDANQNMLQQVSQKETQVEIVSMFFDTKDIFSVAIAEVHVCADLLKVQTQEAQESTFWIFKNG